MNTQKPPFSESTSYEMDFDQPAINIGSHPDNDIVLTGDEVRPFHVSLIVQDGECQVLALDADAEVLLDGKLIETVQFKLAGVVRRLDIGDNQLLLEHNKTFDSLHVRINPATSSILSDDKRKDPINKAVVGDSAILLNVFSQTDEVEVRQTATYELEIVNAGALVANFTVFVDGVPTEWISISPEEINLYEGQHKRVQINITPPRQPTSTAGQHDLRVSVFSENYPGHQAVARITLRIKPYYEFTLGNLSPREQNIYHLPKSKRLGNTVLPVTNLGNCLADFAISTTDDENACAFDFVLDDGTRLNRQTTLQIPAGQTLLQPIEITPRKRRWVTGKRYSHTTAVQVANQSISSQMVGGSLNSHPFLHLWVIAAMILTLAVIAFIILQPGIIYFQADKAIVEPKDNTIKLTWSLARFTDRVNILANTQPLNNGQPLVNGQTSFTVTPTEPTTYEIVAGNWLSGIFHSLDRRETVTVLVVPPSPTINDFSVDNSTVAPGNLVNISWSVTQADQVTLTVGDSVEVLKDLKGERSVAMKADTLVALEAKNMGGQALRSHFVHVKQPVIKVNKFVVLVHPKTAMQNGTAKGATYSQESDLDTWVKYVELIEDTASDNGYRASFVDDHELDKSEPVMVEWDVIGADSNKIQITTDTKDELPAKSSKPAFPEKSMNYVLTATSGSLVKIFTLPVKVFNGSPPTAPTIDFFQAVPMAILGRGDVKFSWSVSGEWDHIKLINSAGIVADYIEPQGFKSVTVSQSDTYILTALNGNLSSSKPLDITVSPALKKFTLNITETLPDENHQFLVGEPILVTVSLSDLPSDKPFPTGEITISDNVLSSCSITLPKLACSLIFKTAGDKQLQASYAGDSIYQQVTSTKYPVSAKIHVSSPTVDLSPAFSLTDAVGLPIGIPMSSSDIIKHQFKLNEKLYVKMNVKPSAGLLPEDNNGQISLSICKQTNYPVSCNSVLPITSVVTVATGGSGGVANILIPNFPGAGTYVLRFSYRHSENLLAPKDFIQRDIVVSRLDIELALPPSAYCSKNIPNVPNPSDKDFCSFSYSDPTKADIMFEIHQTVGDVYLDTSMPKPNKELWQVFEETSSKPLPCSVETGGVQASMIYFLRCVVNVTGKADLKIKYSYDNDVTRSPDYYMGDKDINTKYQHYPFLLQSTIRTSIHLDVSSYSVGQIINLTNSDNNVLHLRNSITNANISGVTGKITFASSDDPGDRQGLFGVVPGSACTLNSRGDVVEIDIDQICQIFFRKVGTWNIQMDFSGDDNYAPSSKNASEIVTKEGRIKATWYYDKAGIKTSWNDLATIDTTTIPVGPYIMSGRIVFSGPATFSNNALDGVSLTMTGTSSFCTVKPASNPPAITYQASQAVFDFAVTCENRPAKSNLSIQFTASDNFSFASVNDTSRQVLFANQNNVGGVYFAFEPVNKNLPVDNFIFDWKNLNPSDRIVKMLYLGETYRIHLIYQPILIDTTKTGLANTCPNLPQNVPPSDSTTCLTVDNLLDFIQYADANKNSHRAINIAIPPSWVNKISVVSGPCALDNGKIVVYLDNRRRYFEINNPLALEYVELSSPAMKQGDGAFTTYTFNDATNSCTVSFEKLVTMGEKDIPFGKNAPATFSLSTSPFIEPTTGGYIQYSAGENYTADGLTKSLVTNTSTEKFITKVRAGSAAQTVTMILPNDPETGRSPFAAKLLPLSGDLLGNLFDFNPSSCMTLSGKIDVTKNKVTWTMTPLNNYPCAGTFSIYYKGNLYFRQRLLVSQDVQLYKPLATPTTGP